MSGAEGREEFDVWYAKQDQRYRDGFTQRTFWEAGYRQALEDAAARLRERRDAYLGVNAITVHEVEQCLAIVVALKKGG